MREVVDHDYATAMILLRRILPHIVSDVEESDGEEICGESDQRGTRAVILNFRTF
jgi:hypothetical protein